MYPPRPKKEVYTLSPGTHEPVSSRGKRRFACDQMKGLEMGDYLDDPGGSNLTSRRGREDQVWRQCVIRKVEASVMRAHELRNAGSSGS